MLHTPITDRIVLDEHRLPPGAGILLVMASAVLFWGAIYAGFVLAF